MSWRSTLQHAGIAALLAMSASLPGCAGKDAASPKSRVAIEVTENGFEPAVVTVPAGKPVTLVVTRRTDATCATDFVMPDRGIRQPLPLNQPVEIVLAPGNPATLHYACAMDMYKGTVEVR